MELTLLDPSERPPGVPEGAVWFAPEHVTTALNLFRASCPTNWGPLRLLVRDDAHWRIAGVADADDFDVAHGVWAWTTAEAAS